MKKVISAGIITYRTSPQTSREYLILKYTAGHWDLPKGKMEKNEAMQETALRELHEETGLSATLKDSFTTSFSFDFIDHNGEMAHKKVVFFLGEAVDASSIKLSHEHTDAIWLPYEKAIKQLTYENAQKAVALAEQFLKNCLHTKI